MIFSLLGPACLSPCLVDNNHVPNCSVNGATHRTNVRHAIDRATAHDLIVIKQGDIKVHSTGCLVRSVSRRFMLCKLCMIAMG